MDMNANMEPAWITELKKDFVIVERTINPSSFTPEIIVHRKSTGKNYRIPVTIQKNRDDIQSKKDFDEIIIQYEIKDE